MTGALTNIKNFKIETFTPLKSQKALSDLASSNELSNGSRGLRSPAVKFDRLKNKIFTTDEKTGDFIIYDK